MIFITEIRVSLLLLALFTFVPAPTYAQEALDAVTYSIPETWNGDSTISARDIGDVAPPLELAASTGEFTMTYLSDDGTIRILPDKQADTPGQSLMLVWSIATEVDEPLLAKDSVVTLQATARTHSPPAGVLLTIREYDGSAWASSSVPMTEVSWTDYSVTRRLGDEVQKVQVGLSWTLPSANAWLEFRDMTVTISSETAAESLELSPTDTPTPAVAASDATDAPTVSPRTGPIIVVTSTPTPPNIFAAATQVIAAMTQEATSGTPTPTPLNQVTATPTPEPYVVTSTPTPANEATATYIAAVETAVAVTTGTATPWPDDVLVLTATPTSTSTPAAAKATPVAKAAPKQPPTKTPTPIFVAVSDLVFPTATATPPFPAELYDKILFKSDYLAPNARNPRFYMINPDGTGLSLLTSGTFYNRAKERDAYSADERFYAYNQREPLGGRSAEIQIYYNDLEYGSVGHQLTYFGTGTAWAPAFSPSDSSIVALVSNESDNDEIWIARREQWPAQQITKNEWEWDRSPSFSPDGRQIAFESNRVGGTRQIWVMDANGENPRQVTNFPFEAWEPVWVKYTD